MPNLGNFFPDDSKRQFVSQRMIPGVVLYLFCAFIHRPKEKFLALAFVSEGDNSLLTLLINSEITSYAQERPYLLNCQVLISASEYSFLDHDSYIDCANVIDHFDCRKVESELLDNLDRIKGNLSATTRADLLTAVQGARTISPYHKRLIVNALQQV